MKGTAMLTLHPEIVTKEGNNRFVMLPYDEFIALQEMLEDAEDVLALRAAKKESMDTPGISLAEVKKRFNIE